MDLPYRAEYAKSGRASCRGCKSPIGQGTLRLAVMVQSPMFDGKTPNWYHFMCFFSKQRPKTVDDINHFESLRYEDQQKISEKINVASTIVPDSNKKGKKRSATETVAKKAALKDFKLEYSKSSRATCRGCEQKIMKDEIRISKKDYETEVGMKYGGQDMWHHLTCFAKLRSELGYFESADKLPGFKALSKDDQKTAKEQLPAIKQEEVPSKIAKTEDVVDSKVNKEEKLYKEQSILIYKNRDKLKDNLSKSEMIELLTANKQEVPVGEDRVLDRLSDIMTFGALEKCKVCKNGQYVFNKGGYICLGNLTEWTKCNTITKSPERRPFKIPKEMKDKYSFLKKYKYLPKERLIKDVKPSTSVKKEETDSGPKVKRDLPLLYNMDFVILGKPNRGKDVLKKQIQKWGGKVSTKISNTTMAVIATEADVEKMGSRMKEAKENQVHVIPEEFFDECEGKSGKIPDLIVQKTICDWGSDPNIRLPPEPSTSNGKSKSSSIYTSSMPSKVKLKLKSGGAVDPDSGIDDIAHIYQDGSVKYNAILGVTDIQNKRNSYYKLQLLEADKGNKYWVFRAWGRIGTTIGGNKLEPMSSLYEAIEHFESLYLEKSGNDWANKDNFVKVAGLMYPIDVEYGGDDEAKRMAITDVESSLSKPVQDLIKIIFDVNLMEKVMLEFELDTEKMPLGKLSKKQIQRAYGVLTELLELIENEGEEARFIDASNRFYTFIPHSCGVSELPILRDIEVVKQKIDMLDNLMELEIAYNLMKSGGSDHSVDNYYKQLNTEIDVLSTESEEYGIIKEYVANTHAETHRSYELDVEEVYCIKRKGEEKKYKPFRKLPNRKLLWHGSRITNYAGILSQGLRIAPPEAPVTGYMFGKGIYFADMVSKSANYCCTSPSNSTGLLLLCEVALGKMHEKTQAEYITKLPKGKHSTKGVGRTAPDKSGTKIIDGVEVPAGKGVTTKISQTSLLYNEYIVYDVAQVNIKYLLKVNFKYKY